MRVSRTLCAIAGGLIAVSSVAQIRQWTSTEDFGTGTFFNTNATTALGEVRLSPQGTAPTAFLNVPVGGGRLVDRGWPNTPGRIMRIDTRTLRVVGEYRLTPQSLTSMPSRAVVDSLGNVWATNAYDGGTVAVTKIGVIIGGTRHAKLGTGIYVPDLNGEYVKDPVFTTGVDRDGDGYIRTSAGLDNLLPWQATTGGDLDSSIPAGAPGTVTQADDELILVFKRHRGQVGAGSDRYTRALAIDGDNDVWVGFSEPGYGVIKLDGDDGRTLDTLLGPSAGYFLLWDSNRLWSSRIEGGARVDLGARTFAELSFPNTSKWSCVAPLGDGNVVIGHNERGGLARLSIVNGADGTTIRQWTVPGSADQRGIVVGRDGHIWVASRGLWAGGNQRVYRYRQDGTYVSEFSLGTFPCGLGVDADGYIWVTLVGEFYVARIDPARNGGLGGVDALVYTGIGSYNYSDGTGGTTATVSRDGEWRGIYDSFRPNTKWGALSWNAEVPAQTSLEVFARAANTTLGLQARQWSPATNGQLLPPAVRGRYVEVRVRMSREAGTPPSLTPRLFDITVRFAPGTVSGTVGLQGLLFPDTQPPVNFELLPTAGGPAIDIPGIELGLLGAFSFTTDARGDFFLTCKGSHWLRQRILAPIRITDLGVTGQAFSLINGDCQPDNVVDLSDFLLLASVYETDTVPGTPEALADLDESGRIDLGDFLILASSYEIVGD